jgi:hypothetical protein
MPYWMNLDTLKSFALAFGTNACLAALIGGVGLVVVLVRGKGFQRGLAFGGSTLFLPLLMPAFACSLLITSYLVTSSFLAESVATTGQVIGLNEDDDPDGGVTYSAVVTFTAQDGQAVTFRDSSKTCSPPCNRIGDQVPVRYRVVNPEDAIITRGIGIWLTTGVMGILTGVFLLLPLGLIWKAIRTGDLSTRADAAQDVIIGG